MYSYTQECDCMSDYVKDGWKKIKESVDSIKVLYSQVETRNILMENDFYIEFFGRAKNRTMMKHHPKLYRSIYKHTEILETTFKKQKSYKGKYSFTNRLKFIVEKNYNIKSMKCSCGKKYTWNTYCRKCPDYHDVNSGKKMDDKTKQKCRVSTLKYLQSVTGQIMPRYNKNSIPIIEQFGKENGYKFMHAENGGEFHIKELGYFVDAYDKESNVVLEIDEKHHFDVDGKLKNKDVRRQNEIENFLKCEFIRLKI